MKMIGFITTIIMIFLFSSLFSREKFTDPIAKMQSPDTQEQTDGVIEFIQHHEKYKSSMLGYLKKMSQQKKLPPDAILYAIGFTQSQSYFSYTYKFLSFEEAESRCVYDCAPVFAALLTAKNNVVESGMKKKTVAMGDFESKLEYFKKKKCQPEKTKDESLPTINFASPVARQNFEMMQKMSFKQLMEILKKKRLPKDYDEIINAATLLGSSGKVKTDTEAKELLLLLLTIENDDSDGIHGQLRYAIISHLFKSKNKIMCR